MGRFNVEPLRRLVYRKTYPNAQIQSLFERRFCFRRPRNLRLRSHRVTTTKPPKQHSPFSLCTGLGSGIWIILHTRWVLFTKSKVFKWIFRWPYLYPFLVSASVASLTFPPSAGQFFASHVGTGGVMKQLFSNFSWTDPNLTIAQKAVVDNWTTYRSGIFAHLPTFLAYNVSG